MILNGGFIEHEVPDQYDVLGELNAGNSLARRSLEDMQATEGQFWGHRVMLQAATDGATPSEGILNRRFRIGNRERSMREQYITGQSVQLCGRMEAKLQQLVERHYNLLRRGLQEAADLAGEVPRTIGLRSHEERFPNKSQIETPTNPGNPVPERNE